MAQPVVDLHELGDVVRAVTIEVALQDYGMPVVARLAVQISSFTCA